VSRSRSWVAAGLRGPEAAGTRRSHLVVRSRPRDGRRAWRVGAVAPALVLARSDLDSRWSLAMGTAASQRVQPRRPSAGPPCECPQVNAPHAPEYRARSIGVGPRQLPGLTAQKITTGVLVDLPPGRAPSGDSSTRRPGVEPGVLGDGARVGRSGRCEEILDPGVMTIGSGSGTGS
jgi:hypothetical protein